MANSSGFVDFSQQLAATGDEEQRLLEQAMQRAEEAQGKAQAGLRQVGRESRGRYGKDGQLSDGTDIAETASYSDYLSAKGAAAKAWQAVTSPDVNPRGMRSVVQGRMGVDQKRQQAGQGLSRQQAGYHRELGEQRGSNARQRTAAAAQQEAKQRELAARQAAGDKAKAGQSADLRKRIGDLWNKSDDAGAWNDEDRYQLGELERRAQQDGSWDEANRAGAWGTEAEYNAADSDVGFSPETSTVFEAPTDRAFGAPDKMRGKRRGGFKGWGT